MFWPAASPVENSNSTYTVLPTMAASADRSRQKRDVPAVISCSDANWPRSQTTNSPACGRLANSKQGARPDLLVATQCSGPAGAVHCVESVLKRGYERAFTRRKRDERNHRRSALPTMRRGAGYSERDAREANESFDAAGQLFRVYFNAGAADLLNLVARCAQAAAAFPGGLPSTDRSSRAIADMEADRRRKFRERHHPLVEGGYPRQRHHSLFASSRFASRANSKPPHSVDRTLLRMGAYKS